MQMVKNNLWVWKLICLREAALFTSGSVPWSCSGCGLRKAAASARVRAGMRRLRRNSTGLNSCRVLCKIKMKSWCTYDHMLPWALIAFEYFSVVSFSGLTNYFCRSFLSHINFSAASYFTLLFFFFSCIHQHRISCLHPRLKTSL